MGSMSKAGRDGGTDDDEHGQGRFGIFLLGAHCMGLLKSLGV